MLQLRKSTAETIKFVMVDSNGTEVTGLGSGFTISVNKPGSGSFVAGGGTKSELGSGWYQYVTTTGETDTEGELAFIVTGSGAVQQNLVYQVGALATWSSATRTLTQGAASIQAIVDGSDITVYRGTTWVISLTGLGSLSNYDTIYFSVKRRTEDSEDNAILRVKNDANGLERFNKAAPVAATNGTITIDDAGNGDITITVQEGETAGAPTVGCVYDVKGVDDDGQVDLLSSGGRFTIKADVTRAIT